MPRLTEESFGTGDQRWLGSSHGIWNCRTVPIDVSLLAASDYPNGFLPAGFPLGVVTASGLVGPYSGDSTDEVQTLTEGGSGLTSFTVTYAGQTTASLDDDATAAEVQAALAALSTVGAGNVLVTGGPLATGPFSVAFVAGLANTNVAAMTTTPTGGTGTVVVATTTAGGADAGSDGRQVLEGFLFTDQPVGTVTRLNVPLLDHGRIRVDFLPVPFLATGHNTTGQFVFVAGGA